MRSRQIAFFATGSDLVAVLGEIERKRPLQYVTAGLFDSPKFQALGSLADAADVGRVTSGDPNLTTSYLVADRAMTIHARRVVLRNGGVKHAIDQSSNASTVALRPGGLFGDNCLIAGQLGTASDDDVSLDLLNNLTKALKRQFRRVKSFYVGVEAGLLLDRGFRLTGNAKSPPLYDLKRD